MSVVSLLGVQVMNNPAKFTDKYEFEITFECLEQLQNGTSLHAYTRVQRRRPRTCPAKLANSSHRSRVEVDLRRFCHIVSDTVRDSSPPF